MAGELYVQRWRIQMQRYEAGIFTIGRSISQKKGGVRFSGDEGDFSSSEKKITGLYFPRRANYMDG